MTSRASRARSCPELVDDGRVWVRRRCISFRSREIFICSGTKNGFLRWRSSAIPSSAERRTSPMISRTSRIPITLSIDPS
jgi:hypothetical protein